MGLQWPTWTGHKCHNKCWTAGMGLKDGCSTVVHTWHIYISCVMGPDQHPQTHNSIAWRQRCHEYSYIAQVSNEYNHLNHFESIFHGCFMVVSGSIAAWGLPPFHTPIPVGFHRGFQVVDAGSGQDVLSKGLDAVKARVSLAKTGQHVAGSPSGAQLVGSGDIWRGIQMALKW